jgi:WD40 repeat protein
MNKNTIIKYIVQHLTERGIKDVSSKLEIESGVQFEPNLIKIIKKLLIEGKIDEALTEIKLKLYPDDKNIDDFHPQLPFDLEYFLILNKVFIYKLFSLFDKNDDRLFLENIRDYMEFINTNNNKYKTSTSRTHNNIINSELELVKQCLTILFNSRKLYSNKSDFDLKQSICKQSSSLDNLLQYINSLVLMKEISNVNDKNLCQILNTVMKYQILGCKFHNTPNNKFSYFFDHQCKIESIPFKVLLSLEQHNEEILNIVYSNTGRYFAAVLKSNNIAVYKISFSIRKQSSMTVNINDTQINSSTIPTSSKSVEITLINTITAAHKNQITSLQWNANDTLILTSSKDKLIKLLDPFTGNCKSTIETHDSMVTSAIFVENDSKILSSGLDYKVSLTNLSSNICEFSVSVPGVTVNELLYSMIYNIVVIISATTNSLIFYDLKSKTEIDKMQMNDVIISCAISKIDNGCYLLVNSSKATPVLNLINLKTKEIKRKYFGHRQERFTIKCNFGGEGENFLLCGSEDAKIYVWNRNHSIPIFVYKAHSSPVNSVIWPYKNNETDTDVIISCSDDHTIKVLGNENVDKAFTSSMKGLEHKIVNIEGNKIVFDTNGSSGIISSSNSNSNSTALANASNVWSRLSNILTNPFNDVNMGYGSEEEDEN